MRISGLSPSENKVTLNPKEPKQNPYHDKPNLIKKPFSFKDLFWKILDISDAVFIAISIFSLPFLFFIMFWCFAEGFGMID